MGIRKNKVSEIIAATRDAEKAAKSPADFSKAVRRLNSVTDSATPEEFETARRIIE